MDFQKQLDLQNLRTWNGELRLTNWFYHTL